MALTLAIPDHMGNALRYKSGLGANDNDVIVQTGDVSAYDEFRLTHGSTGTVDVFPSLDGTNYAARPLTLVDLSSTAAVPATVPVTAGGGIYGFSGTFAALRVLQNGATAPTDVTLMCARRSSR
jgi:hypothetical protein